MYRPRKPLKNGYYYRQPCHAVAPAGASIQSKNIAETKISVTHLTVFPRKKATRHQGQQGQGQQGQGQEERHLHETHDQQRTSAPPPAHAHSVEAISLQCAVAGAVQSVVKPS